MIASVERTLECAAMVVIAAREADARELHKQVVRDWLSFDDLTSDSVMVLVPAPPDEDESHVRSPTEPKALRANGLAGMNAGSFTRVWAQEFWDAAPESKTSSGRARSLRDRTDAAAVSAGFTSTASEVASFFGLPESDLPCVIILSFREQDAFFLTATDTFDFYAFLRECMKAYGPPPRYMDASAELREARSAERKACDELRYRHNRKHGTHRWSVQRESAVGLLKVLALDVRSSVAADAEALIEMLNSGRVPTERDDARAQRVLAGMPHSGLGGTSRLTWKLPRTMSKLRAGLASETVETNKGDDDSELGRRATHWHNEVERLRGVMEDADRRFGFSPAVEAAAEENSLEVRPGPPWRPGWSTRVLATSVATHSVGLSRQ